MKQVLIAVCAVTLLMAGCSRKSKQAVPLQATATGTAIVVSGGAATLGKALTAGAAGELISVLLKMN